MTLRHEDVSPPRTVDLTNSRRASRQLTCGASNSPNSRLTPPAPVPATFCCAIRPCLIPESISRSSSFFSLSLNSFAPSQSCLSMPPSPSPSPCPLPPSSFSFFSMSNTCLLFIPANRVSTSPIALPPFTGMAITSLRLSISTNSRLMT